MANNTLEEKIRKAIEENQLEEQMSVIRMEAVKQNISEEELSQMLEKEKQAFVTRCQQEKQRTQEMEIQKKAVSAAIKYRKVLWIVSAVAIILEWLLIFKLHPAEGQSHHLILTLIVNVITLVAIAIGAAVFFRKHN